ncbi:hypothetical protein BO78DRAFT_466203 [Aspergillus sclerotiicarbonarius CBS 121057]|uniref:Transcription factor domain-containing protein n=1 Tax=Aspergillus sclerotiicarbonarius (strain CBS 121057 / IBT 28362) TaxID=1448318 RepID=A0A319F6M0_ASPSB|nr:hypothetical protein BO78DRAFT_466203 [Aspergillus sclerotiicarbonarius CBS 121057]
MPKIVISSSNQVPIHQKMCQVRSRETSLLHGGGQLWKILSNGLRFQGNVKRALEATFISKDHTTAEEAVTESSLYDRDMIAHLIELFVQEVHTKNPVLDLSQIQADTFHVLTKGFGQDPETCFVLLYCALGAISCTFNSKSLHTFTGDCTSALRYQNHVHYFTGAQKRFGLLWTQSRVKHAQGYFLAGVYLMYSMRPWQALESFSFASNACLTHMMAARVERKIRTDGADGLECSENEFTPCEQRIYWSCMKSESILIFICFLRELAHEYGLKLSPLAQLENPPLLPSPPNLMTTDGNLGSNSIFLHRKDSLADLQERSWYYYLTEITLRKLEMQIHDSFERLQDENLSQFSGETSQDESSCLKDFLQCIVTAIAEFERQLQSCWDQLSSAVDIDLDDVTTGCVDELCEYLRIKYLWIKHDLLRISLTLVLNLDIYKTRMVVANDISGLAETLIRMANDGLKVAVSLMHVSLNTHRNHGSWFGPRIAVMSALEVLAAKKSADRRFQEPAGFQGAKESLIAGLRWWSPHIPDANEYLKILSSLDPMFSESSDD